ncbi:MAG TPA: hypothetical protein VLQ65_04045, partial [Saliniramus sp.]|nr:hypothetical protein [Saliniramus sp.]
MRDAIDDIETREALDPPAGSGDLSVGRQSTWGMPTEGLSLTMRVPDDAEARRAVKPVICYPVETL